MGLFLHYREIQAQSEADRLLREYWLKETFLHWEWWLMLALTIIPWIIWWKIVDRKRLFEILTYGFFVMMISIILDAVGVEFDLWDYRHRIVPFFDVFVTYDMAVMPVIYMVIYQFFNGWKSFIIASILVSAVFAFISEPLLVWMDLYLLINWSYFYSFPIYFAIALAFKYVMIKLIKISARGL
ncbi:CBO0543 family protein [Desulfofalx alkaliphila]|uniref:CBO0543 family protein n=1 Tax=Desulfofalx alkaliphila TaxID=105483 RepID=UPI00068BF431|nr:CBO0543 family protein [Desulfofalx alkaliphila]